MAHFHRFDINGSISDLIESESTTAKYSRVPCQFLAGPGGSEFAGNNNITILSKLIVRGYYRDWRDPS